MTMQFDFYYGDESEQFQFVQVPKKLLVDDRFKSLSCEGKVLYALMLDRMGLSKKNNWRDSANRVFIYYSVPAVMSDLNCSRPKAIKTISELEQFGLILKSTTAGKSTRFYVLNFIKALTSEPVKKIDQSKKLTSKKSLPVPVKKIDSNNTEYNQTISERFIESPQTEEQTAELTTDDPYCRYEQMQIVEQVDSVPGEVRASKDFSVMKILNATKDKNGKQYNNEQLIEILCTASRRYKKQAEADFIGNPWVYYLRVVKSVASQWENIKRREKQQLDNLKRRQKQSPNKFHNFHQREYDYEELEKQLLAKQW